MATMDDGRHGATGDHEDLKIEVFHKAMMEFRDYPYNLSQRLTTEKTKFLRDFRQHFDQTKEEILLMLSENTKGFRRTLIEKKIRIEFHDAGPGLHDVSPTSSSTTSQARPPVPSSSSSIPSMSREESVASSWDSRFVSKPRDLEDELGISPMAMTPTSNPRRTGRNSNPVDQPDSKLRADPVCRFIFLPTSAPNARRLNITEELLLRILTYHQVSPCFLNFLSYFGHEPLSGGGDLFFGGFRSLKSFAEPVFNLKALDRSGYHYQLAFEFRTVFRPLSHDSANAERDLGERNIFEESVDNDGGFGGTRVGDDGDDDDDEDNDKNDGEKNDKYDSWLWPLDRCAIYHHFDVENGNSLWMMTVSEGEGNKPPPEATPSEVNAKRGSTFLDVKNVRNSVNVLSESRLHERFKASLSVLLWLADWSLSEYGQYITMLDDRLQHLSGTFFVNPRDDREVRETGIKILNGYMERLDQLVVALEANLRVCRAIAEFYRDELLQDRRLRARKLAWTTDTEFQAEIQDHLDDFQEKMRWVCTSTQEMLRRAVVVRQVGARRESALHRLIQNRDLKITRMLATKSNELATVATMDSSTMTAFSAMTLILLPISIVSTVFSSGIVDFQTGSGGLVGSWSGPAALWWASITIVLTVLVRWAGGLWRDYAMATTLARAYAARGRKSWITRWATRRAMAAATVALAVPREAGDHDSWMTPALRAIRDARASAQGYASRIRVRYGRAAAQLEESLARYKNARSHSPSSPEPKASPPHHSPYSGHQHPQTVQSREQPPLSSSSQPITSAHSGLPARQPDGDVEEPIQVDGVELEQLEHVSPHIAQLPEISAAPSPESGEPGSKAFDQASEAERGLLVRVTESKEEATNGTDMEGQEQ